MQSVHPPEPGSQLRCDLSVDIGALADMVVKTNDGKGISAPALSALWGLWMRYTVPRIRAGMSG